MKLDQIVAVGSVDGILTSGALLRLVDSACGLTFCQPFTVDKVDISCWFPSSRVAFVDLAVNNRDPKMTEDFVRRIIDAGHTIVAIVDEHDASAWATLLAKCNLTMMTGLAIQPMTQGIDEGPFGVVCSAGDVLAKHFNNDKEGAKISVLCMAARLADQGNFDGSICSHITNLAIKSAIQDDTRRAWLARCAADGTLCTDPLAQKWVNEYEEIEKNHAEILASAKIERGIVSVSTLGVRVDMTSLMMSLYRLAPIAAVRGEMFDPLTKSKGVLVSFGCPQNSGRDLFAEVKNAGILPHGGFAQKVNVATEDYERVFELLSLPRA